MTIDRDALVEKGAKALLNWDVEDNPNGVVWEALTEDVKDVWRDGARAVLDAILPDVRKAALEEAAQIAESDDWRDASEYGETGTPYSNGARRWSERTAHRIHTLATANAALISDNEREALAKVLDQATSVYGTGFWNFPERDALADAILKAGYHRGTAIRAAALGDAPTGGQ